MNAQTLSTEFVEKCMATLEYGASQLAQQEPASAAYDVARAGCIKEFELVLELCGKLLRKRLSAYFCSRKESDSLTFKDSFRHAVKRSLVEAAAVQRWFQYRDLRNSTAHEYGEQYADAVVELLPAFIADAQALITALKEVKDD